MSYIARFLRVFSLRSHFPGVVKYILTQYCTPKHRRPRATARMMNVRLPVSILDAVDRLARELGASKTETVAALLNSALDQMRKR